MSLASRLRKLIISLVITVMVVSGISEALPHAQAASIGTPTLSSVTVTTTGVTVKWTKVSTGSGYQIYRKTGSGSYTKIKTISGNTTVSYSDTTVTNGNTYTYRVRAYKGSKTGSYSGTKAVKYLTTPVISAANKDNSTVCLSWAKNSSATGYWVYRKVGSGSYSKVATITNNATVTWSDSNVTSGTTYTYAVRAYSGSYLSSYTGKTIMYLAPLTKSNVTVSNGMTGSYVKWSAVTGAKCYYVYRRVVGGSYSRIATVTGTSYTDTKVISGTSYDYAVRAVNGSYIGNYNSIRTMYLAALATGKVYLSNTANGVSASWDSISGAACYYVYRRVGYGSYSKIATVTGTSYEDTTVAANTSYFYAVRAVNGSYIGNYNSIPITTDCSHNWSVAEQGEATCTEDGFITYTCSICGESYTKTIAATGHTSDSGKITKAATCTSAGIKTYTCTKCGSVIKTESISATGHTYNSGVITTAATCTSTGVKTYTCTKCGAAYTETIAQTAHTPAAAVNENITSTGYDQVVYCSVCGTKISSTHVNEACSHSFNSGVITKTATCDADGIKTYTCSRCGLTKTETIAATDHSYNSGVITKAATCTTAGVKTYTCSKCGGTYTESIAATGHTSDSGKITTEATCTTVGVKSYACTTCGAVIKTESIAATGHTSDSGKITTAATCTTAGVKTYSCTTCGTVIKTESIAATGHTSDSGKITTAATCTTAGVKTYSCTTCGTVIKTESIAATGHTYDSGVITTTPTCTTAGVKTYTCTTCGTTKTSVVAKLSHSYTATITYPTLTSQGYTTYTCSRCGYYYTDNYTDKLTITEDKKITVAGTDYYLGESVSDLGTPDEKLTSVSAIGYTWYVYGTATYENFFAAGVYNDHIVALVSAGPGFTYQGMKCGDQLGTYTNSNCSVTIATDKNDNNIVHAVMIAENAYSSLSKFTADNLAGESKMNFHLTNAFRVYHGKSVLKWETKAENAAILHSQDMAEYQYFAHASRSDDTRYSNTDVSTRFTAEGISWSSCGENITMGTATVYGNGFQAYNSWVNSSGHRDNMLQDSWTYLGVGGGYSSANGCTYYTQDFWS